VSIVTVSNDASSRDARQYGLSAHLATPYTSTTSSNVTRRDHLLVNHRASQLTAPRVWVGRCVQRSGSHACASGTKEVMIEVQWDTRFHVRINTIVLECHPANNKSCTIRKIIAGFHGIDKEAALDMSCIRPRTRNLPINHRSSPELLTTRPSRLDWREIPRMDGREPRHTHHPRRRNALLAH
jgi:hypothetical protein